MSEAVLSLSNINLLKKPKNGISIFSEKLLNNKEIGTLYTKIEEKLIDVKTMLNDINEKYYINIIEEIEEMKDIIKDEYDFNPPNKYVLDYSKVFIKNLIQNNIEMPDRITPSAEEGICFVFKKNNKILYFEIYNDKEMGYIIEDEKRKKIIDNKNVNTEEEILKVLLNF